MWSKFSIAAVGAALAISWSAPASAQYYRSIPYQGPGCGPPGVYGCGPYGPSAVPYQGPDRGPPGYVGPVYGYRPYAGPPADRRYRARRYYRYY